MQSATKTVSAYLKELPPDRRKAIVELRKVILKNLPKGYMEVMQYGMISYIIPFSRFPDTYNKQPLAYVALASQKNHFSLYLTNVYGNKKTATWFRQAWEKSGKKLKMGKSCVRFTKLEEIPLDVIGKVVAKTSVASLISIYKAARIKK